LKSELAVDTMTDFAGQPLRSVVDCYVDYANRKAD
jgi:hypothetical protein